MDAQHMGLCGTSHAVLSCPMVQRDGMDTWYGGIGHRILRDIPCRPVPSHGTVGRDGHLGWRHSTWDYVGHPTPSCPVPWYSGTGQTFGMDAQHMGLCGTSHAVPSRPIVQWDGMDTWDGCTAHGTMWNIPCRPVMSHGTVGRNGH